MRDTFRCFLVTAVATVLIAGGVAAHDHTYGGYGPGATFTEDGGAVGQWFPHASATVPRKALTRCCPPVSIETCAIANVPQLPDRYSLKIDRLGVVGDQPLLMFRYRRETLFQDPAFAGADPERHPYFPCRASRVLLVREMAPDQYHVLWEGTMDEQYFRLAKVELQGGGAGDILAFTYCVSGTGGCWQELFFKTATTPWRPLEKDGTWTTVYAGMPAGYSLHKSPTIDLETMTWDRAMATQDDPNCCPSGTIKMKLGINAGRLSILSHEYAVRSAN
jgi:hypothetical protein